VGGARRSSTLICAPVMAETVDQMLIQARKAKELGADLVEVRLDFLKNFSPRQDLEILIKQSALPTLITYR
jgi:3-dehydroquinate dehydratase/shikimate dehydrogenase